VALGVAPQAVMVALVEESLVDPRVGRFRVVAGAVLRALLGEE